jgi:hypothetical protein
MHDPPSATPPAQDTAVGQSGITYRISDNMLLLFIAGSVVLFHILTNGRFGFHRDELDILLNARQLDWGYVAYPPFTRLDVSDHVLVAVGDTRPCLLFGASLPYPVSGRCSLGGKLAAHALTA